MATRYIYISNELNEKLSQEDNASALITQLLTAHYDKEALDIYNIEELRKLRDAVRKRDEALKVIKEVEEDATRRRRDEVKASRESQ